MSQGFVKSFIEQEAKIDPSHMRAPMMKALKRVLLAILGHKPTEDIDIAIARAQYTI